MNRVNNTPVLQNRFGDFTKNKKEKQQQLFAHVIHGVHIAEENALDRTVV
jgi:hypothetical protein